MSRLIRRGRVLCPVIAGALIAAALAGTPNPATAAPGDPTYSPAPLRTWTVTGGQIYAMARIGTHLAIGGTFTGLRSPTGTTTPRAHLALIDPTTGAPDPTFNPAPNNTIRALATDGTRLYAGGLFTAIAGQPRANLAALTPTGALATGFTANTNNEVRTLLLHNTHLYAGGLFTTVNGAQRVRVAALSPTTGAPDPTFKPQASWAVNSLTPIPGSTQLALGGEFSAINGQPRPYLAAVHQDTGAVSPWVPVPGCGTTASPCVVKSVTATSTLVFAAFGGPGGRVSGFDVVTGARTWTQTSDGDVQTLALIGGTLLAGGHYDPQFGSLNGTRQKRHEIAALDAATGRLQPFAPLVAGATGIWAILAEPDALHIGGSFTSVNGDTTIRGYTTFPLAPTPVTLVPSGATWAYHDNGTDLGTTWSDPAYDATAWPTGHSQLGFGDGDEWTKVTPGQLTYYFRTTFTVPAGVVPKSLLLEMVRDDGAVIYLNGVEVWRDNLPAGAITAATPANATMGGTMESDWMGMTLPATGLRTGANVIAVEVHNAGAASPDLSLDLRLSTT